MISYIYIQICSLDLTPVTPLRRLWEEDLNEQITDDMWNKVLRKVHESSICAKHAFVQCKIVHRAHLTKARLSKMFPDVDPACDRCGLTPATHAHMMWSCPNLRSYWGEIFDSLTKIAGKQIMPAASIAVFGVPPPYIDLSHQEETFAAFCLLIGPTPNSSKMEIFITTITYSLGQRSPLLC